MPWAAAVWPAPVAAAHESLESPEKGELQGGSELGRRGELQAPAVGSWSRKSSSVEGACLFPGSSEAASGVCLERRGSTSPSQLCNRLRCIPN